MNAINQVSSSSNEPVVSDNLDKLSDSTDPIKQQFGKWEYMRHTNGQVSLKCPKCGYTVNVWTTVYYNYCHCCGMNMDINSEPWWKLE